MNSNGLANWLNFLAADGARIDRGLVTDFGDAAAELAAAREATILSPLAHLTLIEVAGSDACLFLHQQLTSDVRHLAADRAQYSAWCTAKGRMLASFLVFHRDAGYRLQLSADLLALIVKRLQMFVLRSEVRITVPSASPPLLGIAGPYAEAALLLAGLPLPAADLEALPFAAGVVIRLAAQRFEIVVDAGAAPALWQQLQVHARPAGTPVWQWLEIDAGIPLISDATKEEFVPQMAHFEQLGAVSFHKGCYPGQEIVARTQYLGKVKRHLHRAHAASPMAAGQAIYSPASPLHPCGMIVNGAPSPAGGHEALAVVQESFADNEDLELGAPGGPRLRLNPVSSTLPTA
ncbi:MAG: folate-binding protein [Candidatus Accumulibacter sp. UW27]|jgi:folate-binding protein YgfZ